MEMWISKEKCMGCNGCGNVCPKSAIEMKTDRTGFSYPIINQDKCINCGKCKKACPVFEPPSWNRSVHPEVCAGGRRTAGFVMPAHREVHFPRLQSRFLKRAVM